jgi:hypothetical protein
MSSKEPNTLRSTRSTEWKVVEYMIYIAFNQNYNAKLTTQRDDNRICHQSSSNTTDFDLNTTTQIVVKLVLRIASK